MKITLSFMKSTQKNIQLKYFDDLKQSFDLMTYLKSDEYQSMYPPNITKTFGYDNETIFTYKLVANNVSVQWLDYQWHFFYDNNRGIPQDAKIVHAINKEFERVKQFYEKLNL